MPPRKKRTSSRGRPCPTCGRPVEDDRAANPFFPFCGERCRLADLDRWFTEEYAVPGVPDPRAPAARP